MTAQAKQLEFAAFIGGKWSDASTRIHIDAKEFDALTAEDFKAPNCFKHFKGLDNSYNKNQADKYKGISCCEVLTSNDRIRFASDIDGLDTSSDKPAPEDPDLIKNIDDVDAAFEYFIELSEQFGPFSICGYTNNQEIADAYPVDYIANASKIFSAHIVFYTTYMTKALIQEVFATDIDNNYKFDNLKYQDKSIWQPLVNDSSNGHCIRFAMCDKIKRDSYVKGKLVNGFKKEVACSSVKDKDGKELPNSTNLWLADGTEERELTIADFYLAGIKRKQVVLDIPNKPVNALTMDDIVFQPNESLSNDLSNLEVIAEILEHVSEEDNIRSFELMKKVQAWICYAQLWNKEDIADVLDKWYNNGSNTHSMPDSAKDFIERYYKPTASKMSQKTFFYKLMSKVVDEDIRQQLIDKYAPNTLDDTIQIGCDKNLNINILTQADHRYDISQYAQLVADIRKVAAFYNGVYFVLKSNNALEAFTDQQLIKAFPQKIFYHNQHISLAKVIIASVNYISYSSTEFIEPEEHVDSNCFNMFHGYKYEAKQNDVYANDFVTLVSFLLDDDAARVHEPYDRSAVMLKWISEIIKHPGKKTRYSIILQGQQGAGKGTLTDILGELLKGYSLPNINSMEQITGKFNTALLGIMYANCNELQSSVDVAAAKRIDFNALKSRITDTNMMYELKGGKAWNDINVCNYSFNTNNPLAFTIEIGDRRYIVFNTNDYLIGHDDYFTECHRWLNDPERLSAILYYLLHYDENDEIKVDGRYMTPEKYYIIEASASDAFLFLIDNVTALSTTGLTDKQLLDLRKSFGLTMKPKVFRGIITFYCKTQNGRYVLRDGYCNCITELLDYRAKVLGIGKEVKFLETENTGSVETEAAIAESDVDAEAWINANTITSHDKTYILSSEINAIDNKQLKCLVNNVMKTWKPDHNLYTRDNRKRVRGFVKPKQ